MSALGHVWTAPFWQGLFWIWCEFEVRIKQLVDNTPDLVVLVEPLLIVRRVLREQINRLTIVSLMFLPITFLTGFFGMNFDWMINSLGSPAAFFLLGILLPTASVIVTVLWFKRRELM